MNLSSVPARATAMPVDWRPGPDQGFARPPPVLTASGTFSGYASLFGIEDLSHDIVEPGAFQRSLARRGAQGVKMLFHHDPTEPIGAWLEITETAKGLFVVGRLLPDVARAREVLALMQAGILDGLSIGFRTVKGRTDARSGVRRLAEIDLWEISVVTFPMQPQARVGQVKSAFRPEPAPPDAGGALVAKIRGATRRLAALA